MQNSTKKGFTLLELLIVITIISILSVILIVALNPAETLRKARDVQRLSDLASLKNVIAIYITDETSPFLAGSDNTACQATLGIWDSGDKIWYSIDSGTAIGTQSPVGFDGDADPDDTQVSVSNLQKVDGNGWIPVDLTDIAGGSPISNLPIDPTNSLTSNASGGGTASSLTRVNANALVYRYACQTGNLQFEINAALESTAFRTDENRDGKDGGDSDDMYEVGTNLEIFGANTTGTTNAGF